MVDTSFEERIGRVLTEDGFMTVEQLGCAKGLAQKSGMSLLDAIVGQKMVSWEALVTVLSFQLRIPIVDLKHVKADGEAVRLIPQDYAKQHELLPIGFDTDGSLRMATKAPQKFQLSSQLSEMTGRRIKFVFAFNGDLREFINRAYNA